MGMPPHSKHRVAVELLLLSALTLLVGYRSVSYTFAHRQWEHATVHFLERQCPPPAYPTLASSATTATAATTTTTTQQSAQSAAAASLTVDDDDNNNHEHDHAAPATPPATSGNTKICVATLTDERHKRWINRILSWRNFDGLLELTWDNKQAYCDKHGYTLWDESSQIDRTRPPSWSKIRAAQRLMREERHRCDWVFWLDADTIFMNGHKRVEEFLPLPNSGIDLLLARDDGGGYNAGAWLLRVDSDWSRQFLRRWWNLRQFVKPPGLSKSGDNDALKALLRDMEERTDDDGSTLFEEHCAAPPRCTFNSFAKFVPPGGQGQPEPTEWQHSESLYHRGDLVAHVAGVDNKMETLRLLLDIAE